MEISTDSINFFNEKVRENNFKEKMKYREKIIVDCPDNDFPLVSDSSPNSSSSTFNSQVSTETEKENNTEYDNFMMIYVNKLFDSSQEISATDKQNFGEFCQTLDGRKAFAKHVDNHRCCSLEVGESTFYKLAHSFALVLFECNEADDFLPAKTLMNMAFTYYHYPEGNNIQFKNNFSQPIELKSPDLKEFTRHLSGSEEDLVGDNIKKKQKKSIVAKSQNSEDKNSIWKSANNWFSKELILCKQFLKDAPGLSQQPSSKTKVFKSQNTKNDENKSDLPEYSNVDVKKASNVKVGIGMDMPKTEKVYLYQALRYQTIWQSLRFWNAAFFDAVNTERQVHCWKHNWNSLADVEKENVSETLKNLTFAHLGTFIVNMKHLGIGEETCLQFLRKQSVIGNLSKDLYQLLRKQIEMPLQISKEK